MRRTHGGKRAGQAKVLAWLAGLLLALGILPAAQAQSFPSRPLTFIYPYAPGSGVEAVWRTLASVAGRELEQSVVVENRPGAAGRNAILAMATAPRTGYVIAMGSNIELVTHALADPGFKAEPGTDYQPVMLLFKNSQVWYAHPSAPFRDAQGLIAYAKAHPGRLNFGTAGLGTPGHLSLELLKATTGVDLVFVPYKGGTPAILALLGKEVDVVSTDASARQHVDAGRLLSVATTAARRLPPFMDTATFSEVLPGFEVATWYGLVVPPGTPAEVVAKLRQAYGAALRSPEVQARLQAIGAEAMEGDAEAFTALVRADRAKWAPILQKAGVKFN